MVDVTQFDTPLVTKHHDRLSRCDSTAHTPPHVKFVFTNLSSILLESLITKSFKVKPPRDKMKMILVREKAQPQKYTLQHSQKKTQENSQDKILLLLPVDFSFRVYTNSKASKGTVVFFCVTERALVIYMKPAVGVGEATFFRFL